MNKAPIIETGLSSLNAVEDTISQRRSLRGFLDKPVDREIIERILFLAGRAPSGTNMQPWRGHVMTGEALKRFGKGLLAAANDPKAENDSEFSYYPDEFFEPYKSRRRKVGWDLYGLLGIKKGDFEKTKAQHDRNLIFFDAPVGIFVTVHKSVGPNGWGHVGHFIQSICLAAVGKGLGTCLQEAWAGFPKLLKKHLEYGDDEILWCGISLGYEDQDHPANSFRTEREQFDSFAKLLK